MSQEEIINNCSEEDECLVMTMQKGRSSSTNRQRPFRSACQPPPFLLKTHMVVDDPATNDLISWNAGGDGFVVWRPTEFSRDILPTLFKHCNFSSFVRQLNTYGFRKAASGRWEFHNDMFRRGDVALLCQIRRKKAWTSKPPHATPARSRMLKPDEDHSSSSTSSSSSFSNLWDENRRLKRENGALCVELESARKRCKELFDLVAVYGNCSDDTDKEDLDPRPKLFGVRLEIGSQKKRREEQDISQESHLTTLLTQSCK